MRIVASDLALKSQRTALNHTESSERLRLWTGNRSDFEAQGASSRSVIADISAQGRQMLSAAPATMPAAEKTKATDPVTAAAEAAENDPIVALIRRLLLLLTGRELSVRSQPANDITETRQAEASPAASDTNGTPVTADNESWGMEYDYHAVHEEYERTRFSASGTIRTADGQEVSFSLDVAMERHYREETNVSLRAGNALRKDPLVVNFGGTAAQLAAAGRSFRFDLDSDGDAEELPLFALGSGYLALDLDGNGRIDDGNELFGPASGNGFADLARHDQDKNGWIDAGDAVFDRLAVWTPAAEGGGELRSLADLGIGALALAHAATPFELRDAANSDLGAVKASGLYLRENGGAGSLQEIDLTV
jgi:hypothetical protein